MKIWFANLIQKLHDFALSNRTNLMSFEEFSEKMRSKEDMRLGE